MIKPNQDIVSSPFLYESLHWQKAEIIHAAHGAVQQCLFLGDIRNFTILLPDKNSNQEYSTLVNPLFKKIASNRLENTLLTNVSDKLLPRLMSGELPVVNI
jgi:type I restriction enzyme S subunit